MLVFASKVIFMNYTKSITSEYLQKISTDEPLMLIDLAEVEAQYKKLTESLNARVFYAVKSNPEQAILRRLSALGSGFEVASIGELKRLEAIGVKHAEVIFSNPVKIESHIEEAYKRGIHSFAFDSSDEIKKLAKCAPGAKVYLRVFVSNRGSLVDLSSKFGADPEIAVKLLQEAKDNGLHPYGVTFHVGSQAENLSVWGSAIETAARIMANASHVGIKLSVMNIGGGFPIQYSDDSPLAEEVFERIREELSMVPDSVEIWCEPGRFLSGSAGVLVANVIGKSHRGNDEWIYLDVGRFQAFIEMFESDDIKLPVFTSNDLSAKQPKKQYYTLTGPTCDSYDTIYTEVELASGLKRGDKVFFLLAGAYTTVYGSEFNDFPLPRVEILE